MAKPGRSDAYLLQNGVAIRKGIANLQAEIRPNFDPDAYAEASASGAGRSPEAVVIVPFTGNRHQTGTTG